jgi:predicted ATP-grasp superfamily ATP-dependent carboligase
VDFFEDEDLKKILSSGRGRFVGRIDNFEQLPKLIRSVRSSIPMLWAGGLENYSNLLREIGQHRPVIGADPTVVETVRDPRKLSHWLANAAIGVPRLASEAGADTNCLWLKKSVHSSGGMGIGRPSPADSSCPSQSSRGTYLQEYIDGVPMSALFCSDSGRVHLFGMSLQVIGWPSLGASGFLFCGNVGPVDPGQEVTRQVLEAARVIVEQSRVKGVFGIDFILRHGHAWILEVNPRITASHMLYEQQHPGLITHHHLAALGWQASRPKQSHEQGSKRSLIPLSTVTARLILWAREDIRVPKSFGTDSACNPKIADCPQPGTVVPSGSPLCSIYLTGDDTQDVIRQLFSIEENLKAPEIRSTTPLIKLGYSLKSIGSQLQLLWQKFDRFRQLSERQN